MTLANGDPAVALIHAIRSGDLGSLHRLLEGHPGLAAARIGAAGGRTPLHVATDWPGYYPSGPAVVAILIAAGADPNARTEGGPAPETPLHWAASSDDADVAEALIDGGADIEAPGGSIGSPLDNAVGYGCWHVARLLAARGARVSKLWHAAALGMMSRVDLTLRRRVDRARVGSAWAAARSPHLSRRRQCWSGAQQQPTGGCCGHRPATPRASGWQRVRWRGGSRA
jgi:hypothetical protein